MYWSREKVSTLSPAARFDWEGNEKGGTRKAWRNNQPSKTHTSSLFYSLKKKKRKILGHRTHVILVSYFVHRLKKKKKIDWLSTWVCISPIGLLKRTWSFSWIGPLPNSLPLLKKKRGDPYIQCCVHKRTCFGSHWIVLSTGWASACDNPSLRN